MFGHKHSQAGVLQNLFCQNKREITIYRWWFQICFIFTPIWGRFPILTNIFQKQVETTNQNQTRCFATSARSSSRSSRSEAKSLLAINPIGSTYGIFTYIWWICMVNVGKYTSPMDPSWELLAFLNSSSGVLSSTYCTTFGGIKTKKMLLKKDAT